MNQSKPKYQIAPLPKYQMALRQISNVTRIIKYFLRYEIYPSIKCAPNHDVKILFMQNFWDWFRKTLERAGMRETSDPPPERKPPSFSCFLIISPFHSLAFSLSHSLWSPKLFMDSQLTQQEATRFRLLWEEFLLVSSWWWGLNCSFQPSRFHKFSNLKRNWKGGGFSVRQWSSAKSNYKSFSTPQLA